MEFQDFCLIKGGRNYQSRVWVIIIVFEFGLIKTG
jgi:hypothetical protein